MLVSLMAKDISQDCFAKVAMHQALQLMLVTLLMVMLLDITRE